MFSSPPTKHVQDNTIWTWLVNIVTKQKSSSQSSVEGNWVVRDDFVFGGVGKDSSEVLSISLTLSPTNFFNRTPEEYYYAKWINQLSAIDPLYLPLCSSWRTYFQESQLLDAGSPH